MRRNPAATVVAAIVFAGAGLVPGLSYAQRSVPKVARACSAEQAAECGRVEQCQLASRFYGTSPDDKLSKILGDFAVCIATPAPGITAIGCARPLDKGHCHYRFAGEITQQKVSAFIEFLESTASPWGQQRFTVELDSNGGDIDAAMRLGREFRKRSVMVSLEGDHVCASACVLLIAGAPVRVIFSTGAVVIHRPYRSEARVLGADSAQRAYEARNARISAYLHEMNIPATLLDAMLRVPSESGYRLSEDELFAFGLNENDPVYEEERNAEAAKRRGLSMSDYLGRKRRYDDCRKRDGSPLESAASCESIWK